VGEFVFYSEFLALQGGEGFDVGERSVAFAVDLVFKAAVTAAKLLDTIFQRHGSSRSWAEMTSKSLTRLTLRGGPLQVTFDATFCRSGFVVAASVLDAF
jgi:hypothetical protein